MRQASKRVKTVVSYRSRSPRLQNTNSAATELLHKRPVDVSAADREPHLVLAIPQTHQLQHNSASVFNAAQKYPQTDSAIVNPKPDPHRPSITTKEMVNQGFDSPLVSPVSTLSSGFSSGSSSRDELYNRILEQKRSLSDNRLLSPWLNHQSEAQTSQISQPRALVTEKPLYSPVPQMRFLMSNKTPYDEDDFYVPFKNRIKSDA
ncbi:hypothetical protein H4R34_004582 [Dimargaris verticillata]|uniref:Uncharacterized protein n=1 Tax=Dimargaris verticillata TaxID=2761393 RepID=A0A9W8EC27_9FUNG|nr:hypothetical protein H4R34_004582 [Dimargaris verticillata]